MEIAIGIGVIAALAGIAIFAFSSEDTKLLRRLWAAQKARNFESQYAAISRLLAIYEIDAKRTATESEREKLFDGVARLTKRAIAFDARNPRNLGVSVSTIVINAIRSELASAGISEADDSSSEAGARQRSLVEAKPHRELRASDREIFKTFWAANVIDHPHRKNAALQAVLENYNVNMPDNPGGPNIAVLRERLAVLMAHVVEYDMSVDAPVARKLAIGIRGKLHARGIREFDEQIDMIEAVEFTKLAQSMSKGRGYN